MFGNDQTVYQFRGPFRVRVEVRGSLMLLALLSVGLRHNNPEALIWALAGFAIMVVSIFLHELGHAWGSLVQRIPVRRIVLYGGGGYCESAMSSTPRQQELVVAMGPLVNLAIWALASLAANGLWSINAASDTEPSLTFYRALWLLETVAGINLFLALFNLLPVQPLDGGKLFQLALLRLFDTRTATRVAGAVGLVMCLLWVPAMIYVYITHGWVLFFIPSLRLHRDMAMLREYRHLRRRD